MMPQVQQPEDIAGPLEQIKEFIQKHSSGIIVLPSKATPDAIAAGTSLYLALLKLGKNCSLISSFPVQSDLAGADKIKSELETGGDNLVVSFPYEDGSIDKVDYNIQGNRFNLVIVPREGHAKLDTKEVQYTYSGGKIDFIITVDCPNLHSLGELYQKNQRQFEGSTIINIDRHLINASYGMINLVSKSVSSTSELILKVIKVLKGEIDRDIATNLYSGISAATNNFTAYSVNADTFEAVAFLLRVGAVKKPVAQQNTFGRPNFGSLSSPMGGFGEQSFEKQTKAVSQVEQVPVAKEGQSNTEVPENFLKPKIFSGSGLL